MQCFVKYDILKVKLSIKQMLTHILYLKITVVRKIIQFPLIF